MRRFTRKMTVLAVLMALIGAVYFIFADSLSLQSLAAREQQLRQLERTQWTLIFCIAFLLYVAVCLAPIFPGKSVIYGWLFGFWYALIVVSFASTLAALIAFFVGRFVLRDLLQSRFGLQLATINEAILRDGNFFLLSLRMIAVIPYTIVNPLIGRTAMRPFSFWWTSQLGMLPGNCICVYAGAQLPGLARLQSEGIASVLSPELLIGFGLLGCLAITSQLVFRWWSRRFHLAG